MDNNQFFDILLGDFQTEIIVFARAIGIFIFNPIFARKNIPTIFKIGASMALTIFIVAQNPQQTVNVDSLGQFMIILLFEGFIGFILGFMTQLFLSTILVSGDIMDTQSGLGMAKIYDPSSGVQMPLFGSVTTYMFMLYFFVTNSHLAYIKIFALSYDAIPIGMMHINPDVGMVIVEYFATVLGLAIKLALPFIASQLFLEVAVGIMMKAVPQIQVMAVNIQVKLLFGLVMLYAFAVPMSNFIDKYMQTMLESIHGLLPVIAG